MNSISIIVSGGVVQAVESSNPDFIGKLVRIIDLDVEASDEPEAVMVSGSARKDANVFDWPVVASTVYVEWPNTPSAQS